MSMSTGLQSTVYKCSFVTNKRIVNWCHLLINKHKYYILHPELALSTLKLSHAKKKKN